MNAFLTGSDFQRNNISYALFVITESDFRSPLPQSCPWQPPSPPCPRQRLVCLTTAHGDPEHSPALLPEQHRWQQLLHRHQARLLQSKHMPQLRGNAAELRPLSFCPLLMVLTLLQHRHQESISHLEIKWRRFPFLLWYSLQKEQTAKGTTSLQAAAWVKATPAHVS